MITLESMLPADELASFNTLVAQATAQHAGAVAWHSPSSGVLVVGFCKAGELMTWFATPANNATEAAIAQQVILLGVSQASQTMAAIQSGAYEAANAAIQKAMH